MKFNNAMHRTRLSDEQIARANLYFQIAFHGPAVALPLVVGQLWSLHEDEPHAVHLYDDQGEHRLLALVDSETDYYTFFEDLLLKKVSGEVIISTPV